MAYTVNWITKVVTIPLADLALVSGVNYTLNVDFAHDEIRRLEWEFTGGLWAEHAITFVETQVLSGITYSPIVKLVNGYTWEVAAANIIVSLLGSNSNFLDTFTPANGVSVLANNSAGKIVSGSGLDTEQDTKLDEIYAYLGLDSTNPIEHTPTQSVTDDDAIDITRSGDGENLSRLVRQ